MRLLSKLFLMVLMLCFVQDLSAQNPLWRLTKVGAVTYLRPVNSSWLVKPYVVDSLSLPYLLLQAEANNGAVLVVKDSNETVSFSILANAGGIMLGDSAGRYITSGIQNVGIGKSVFKFIATGKQNVSIGDLSSRELIGGIINTGSYNTVVGHRALMSADSAFGNCVLGNNAMNLTTYGRDNCVVGRDAMQINTTGSFNAAFGFDALIGNTTGSNNVGIGSGALYSNGTASGNVAVGDSALWSSSNSSGNVAIGRIPCRTVQPE